MAGDKILAQIARKGGGRLLEGAIDTLLPSSNAAAPKRKSLLGGVAGVIATRIATRSVPGAIVVGGAVIAKKLYDRRHAARTAGSNQSAGKEPDKA